MFSFTSDYLAFVFLACFGTIQIAAFNANLHALLIFKSPIFARVAGIILVAVSFVGFFVSEDRNINDYEGGLDANQQAIFFVIGTLAAIVATMTLSSIRNFRMNGNFVVGEGLDALGRMNYARALAGSLRYWRGQWKTRIVPYLFG